MELVGTWHAASLHKGCARHEIRDNNMKKTLFLIVICAVLTSCSPTLYYQMYQTEPITARVEINDNVLVYEDDNCVVSYNFWRENGDFGFKIYNKNTENIYLHMDECFFVKNGMAYDYYDFGVEPEVICVPAKTAKIVSEFKIASGIYHDCDLYLNPGKKDKISVSFTQENTPLKFGNIIAYSVGDTKSSLIRFNNDFYISKVSNYKYKDIIKTENKTECGKKLSEKETIVTESAPDRFYNSYIIKTNAKKH